MTEISLSSLDSKQTKKLGRKFYLHCVSCTGVLSYLDDHGLVCTCCGTPTSIILIDDAAIANDKTLAAIAKERAATRLERAKNEAWDAYESRPGADGTRVISLYK